MTNENRREFTYRFVRHEDAEAFICLGWLPHPALEGTGHGFYSVLMEWCCQCPVREPIDLSSYYGARMQTAPSSS